MHKNKQQVIQNVKRLRDPPQGKRIYTYNRVKHEIFFDGNHDLDRNMIDSNNNLGLYAMLPFGVYKRQPPSTRRHPVAKKS